MGVLEPARDGVPLALLQLGLQQHVEVAQVAVMLALGLLGQACALPGDGREVELLAVLLDHGLGQRRRLGLGLGRRRAHRTTAVATGARSWSYSPTVGSGRSNWASTPTSTVAGRACSRLWAVTRCRTAASSVQPSTNAASIAPCSANCPCVRPS